MTTIIDPAGTPIPVYNRDGVTVVDIAPDAGSPSTPTPVPHVSKGTICRVTPVRPVPNQGNNPIVVLPGNAEIGDWVELHGIPGEEALGFNVVAASGEAINQTSPVSGNSGEALFFRKIDTALWGAPVR